MHAIYSVYTFANVGYSCRRPDPGSAMATWHRLEQAQELFGQRQQWLHQMNVHCNATSSLSDYAGLQLCQHHNQHCHSVTVQLQQLGSHA